MNPDFIGVREPVSALDVRFSADHQLLENSRKKLANLPLHRSRICHVSGHHDAWRLCPGHLEVAASGAVAPAASLTRALLSAYNHSRPGHGGRRERIILRGELPSPMSPSGMVLFHTRCPGMAGVPRTRLPGLRKVAPTLGGLHSRHGYESAVRRRVFSTLALQFWSVLHLHAHVLRAGLCSFRRAEVSG